MIPLTIAWQARVRVTTRVRVGMYDTGRTTLHSVQNALRIIHRYNVGAHQAVK